ncbi:estrogen sulfotransferase-like [Dendronephthya gigantea]|uniref:estrogen sulfotransferase-like n=1 Tax=Dendronephthya gigantea TaxID=151771 RepID=UPI0010698ED3|nr:estrogen sulfotransferase-like [Dendronephthya gigantea]
MELMVQKVYSLQTEEGRMKGLRFKPRPSDIIIVTPLKCGTTWVQQIAHQLKTGGDMDFKEITEVVPYIESAHDMHLDLEAEQRANPRCYKNHTWYDHCPKGGKYIVIYREPCAVAYSLFKFMYAWFFQPDEITLEQFILNFFLVLGKPQSEMEYASYFEHFISWWKHRNDPNVLFLFYEEMKEDLETAVKAIALFMGIHDQERIQNAVRMSTFEFMKANENKFNENLLAFYRNKACGIPEGICNTKVATGSVDEALKVLPQNVQEAIQKKWQEIITKETGYESYDKLRVTFRKEKPLKI